MIGDPGSSSAPLGSSAEGVRRTHTINPTNATGNRTLIGHPRYTPKSLALCYGLYVTDAVLLASCYWHCVTGTRSPASRTNRLFVLNIAFTLVSP